MLWCNFSDQLEKLVNPQEKKLLKCPLCQHVSDSRANIIGHFNENHALKIDDETLEFSCFDDFLLWKSKIEKETFSSFILFYGTSQNRKSFKYRCHRSGDIVSKTSNTRALKTQGSNKINAYCPANIKVVCEEARCVVTFCKTHVGHLQEEEMGHLFLSTPDKLHLATKIATKIPLPTILNDIRSSVSNSLERTHLTTMRDLHNIENAYNLNKTSVRHKNDAVSVDAWVNDLQKSDSILYYKPQDVLCTEHPVLKQEDFFLAIMTPGQKDLLLRRANYLFASCLCSFCFTFEFRLQFLFLVVSISNLT